MDATDAPPHSTAPSLDDRYWYVEGTGAELIDVPVPELWQQLMSGRITDEAVGRIDTADGWLVSSYRMDADMTHSEVHPHGDELHFLVSGRITLVLEDDDGAAVEAVDLRPGAMAVVPRAVWHHIVVHEPAHAVALTAGRGTEHRTRPTAD